MSKKLRLRTEVLGKKLGMTKVFDADGIAIPVTVIEFGENIITEVRTKDKNGYSAVQIGSLQKKEKNLTKAQAENLKKKNLPLFGDLREFRIKDDATESYKVGDKIKLEDLFKANEKCDISGTSIGKGFQGMVKLHNKTVGSMSHGSKSHRGPGSIGGHTEPGRVFPGKRMPSRMGNEKVTVRNLRIVEVNLDDNIILVEGAVPGSKGSTVMIKPALAKKGWNNVA